MLFEILVEDGVVLLDDRLEQMVTHLDDLGLERRRDRPLDVFLAKRGVVVVVDDLALTDQVDDPGEQFHRAQRQGERLDISASTLPHPLVAIYTSLSLPGKLFMQCLY